ncbi:MAG: HNH endonuclease [Parvularculaceae bacterium]|nr:HNH endonuclease [Parvularculaceae bacterium]
MTQTKFSSEFSSPLHEKIAEAASYNQQREFVPVGNDGSCRYCDLSLPKRAKPSAHLIPEALGNKKIFSRDECNVCNRLFSAYDNELARFARPLLSIGYISGKSGVPKNRGEGVLIERRFNVDGSQTLFVSSECEHFADTMHFDPWTGAFHHNIPNPNIRFRPMFAYKALSKIGFGLLPRSEIPNFLKLKAWLQHKDDTDGFHILDVGFQTAIVPNPFPVTYCALFRRRSDHYDTPYMLFILTIGALLFHIDLMPDSKDESISPRLLGTAKIEWKTKLGGSKEPPPVEQKYENPMFFNWASPNLEDHPFSHLHFRYHLSSNTIQFRPVGRERK